MNPLGILNLRPGVKVQILHVKGQLRSGSESDRETIRLLLATNAVALNKPYTIQKVTDHIDRVDIALQEILGHSFNSESLTLWKDAGDESDRPQVEDETYFSPNPNLTLLAGACEEYLDFIASEEFNEDEIETYEHMIFERAMEAVFGDDVFDYVNKKIQERENGRFNMVQ